MALLPIRSNSLGGARRERQDMARRFLVVAGIVLVLGFAAQAAASGEEQFGSSQSVAEAAATGKLAGIVTAADGMPVGDVLVSLSGPGGSLLAFSDSAGRFWFDELPAGLYLLRTHLAGGPAGRRVVQVEPGEALLDPLVLDGAGQRKPELLLAGSTLQFGSNPTPPAVAESQVQPYRDEAGDARSSAASTPGASGSDSASEARAQGPDSKMRWLRRARRSVLKDRTIGASVVQPGVASSPGSGEAGSIAERWAASSHAPPEHPLAGLAGLPVSGEVQLLTRANLAGPSFLWPPQAWPGQVAYVSVAPSGAGDWALRGTVDMTTGATSSWAIAGWYSAALSDDHDLQAAISYSRQAYAAAADLRLDSAGLVGAGVPSREVGRIEAADTWVVSPTLEVSYGAELARYAYLDDDSLFSPRASVTMSPVDGNRVRATVSRNIAAPGGEQFLPPLDGVWLPPERTYTSLPGFGRLNAERVRHVELGWDHDLGEHSVVGVRRFSQRIDGQLMAMFAPGIHAPVGGLAPSGGHYYLAGTGDVDVDGWGVTFAHALEERLRGAVDYRVVRAERALPGAAGIAEPAAEWFGSGVNLFQDVAATLEAEIPETSTRIVARCRISTAYARVALDGVDSGLDTRFDVQVTQALPFAPFEGSSWELLVALRSLFYEPTHGASVYDELLVVDPPRQLVGGLVVHF